MSTVPESQTPTTDGAAASPGDRHAPPVAASGQSSGKATAALVLGIIGAIAFFIPLIAWILGGLAIGLGVAARSEIRSRGLDGLGRAKAGLILGIIAVVAGTIVFAVNLAIAF